MFGHKHKLGEYSKKHPIGQCNSFGQNVVCWHNRKNQFQKKEKNIFSIFFIPFFWLYPLLNTKWEREQLRYGQGYEAQVISNSVFRSNSIHQVITKWSDVYFVNSFFSSFSLNSSSWRRWSSSLFFFSCLHFGILFSHSHSIC